MPTDTPDRDALQAALEKALRPIVRRSFIHAADCDLYTPSFVSAALAAVAPLLAAERAAREAAEQQIASWHDALDAIVDEVSHLADRLSIGNDSPRFVASFSRLVDAKEKRDAARSAGKGDEG